MDVAFIGGGALSLFSAYFLSKHHNLNITIYEKNAKVGRKLTNSGNGRGNFSNMYVAVNKYNNEAFVAPLINAFTPKDFIAEVESLGLLTYADEQGRIYPLSEQGIVFNELLLNHLNKHNVSIKENTEVKTLKKQGSKFIVNEVDEYEYVIFATGSNAGLGKNLQSKTPVSILNALGHTFIPYTPTLASIGVKENIHSINGRRNKADLKLIINDKEVYTNSGEVLFRKDALSGIAIFELSSILAWEKLKNPNLSAKISLDLLPFLTNEQAYSQISSFSLTSLFHPSIVNYINKVSNNTANAKTLAHNAKNLIFNVNNDYIPDNNQVYAGGVNVHEVDNLTLESKKVPNLFIGGELLNIDGLCGGYNLHFAFACGIAIAKEIINRTT